MSKDPSPRADALRAQREARYGHLQATTEPKPARKLIPYAGKETKGIAPVEKKGPRAEAQAKRTEARKQAKRKRKASP